MFEGQVEPAKRLKLHYDDVERYYHVITKLTIAIAKKYICNACNKLCRSDETHVSDQPCSDCTTSPPCAFEGIRIPCEEYNRKFRSRACFFNHKRRTAKKRNVCESKRCCGTCGALVAREDNALNKRYCQNLNQNKEAGHRRPLKNCCPAAIACCTYSTILTQLRTQYIRMRLRYKFWISSAYISYVRGERTRNTSSEIAFNVAWESTCSRIIL